ncbi:MAG: hypothetical protein OHK0038_00750 [Flammeovirgaceae bacterium]
MLTYVLLMILIILVAFFTYQTHRYFQKKAMERIIRVVRQVSEGNLSEKISLKSDSDLGKIAQYVDKILENLSNASHFTKSIGEGKFDVTFQPSSNQDQLGHSLITMRNRLKTASEEENIRNWTNEGIAKFLNLLRQEHPSIDSMLDKIIAELVEYLGFNQGGIFIFNEFENEYLDLRSCYAYHRKKFLEKRIHKEQGIIGQAIQEKSTIYLTNLPEGYTEITSGLGTGTPKSLLIVPLKQNQEIEGAIELASFKLMLPYEIAFIEKLSENIASTIRNMKVGNNNLDLMKKMQEQSEIVKQHEEELRENNEELISSQEEMRRQQILMQDALKEAVFYEDCLKSFLHNSKDFFFAINKDHVILFANQSFSSWAINEKIETIEGVRLEEIYEGELVAALSDDLASAFTGKRLSSLRTIEILGKSKTFEMLYAPVFSENKDLIAVLISAKDVSDIAHLLDNVKSETRQSIEEHKQFEEKLISQLNELQSEMNHLKTSNFALIQEINNLRMENMMLEQILTVSEESFFILDEKGKVLHISHSAAHKLGIEANDILGEQLQDILPIQIHPERKIVVEDDLGKLHEINFGKKITTNILIGGTIEKTNLRAFLALHQEQAFFVIFIEMSALHIPISH